MLIVNIYWEKGKRSGKMVSIQMEGERYGK